MKDVWPDVKFAARLLARSPGFTAVALLTLALGIGANTAIFSAVHDVLLRPLGYPDSHELVLLARKFRTGFGSSVSIPSYLHLRAHQKSFTEVAVTDVIGLGLNLTGAGEPERVPSIRVSASWFKVMGVAPQIGRGFLEEEDRPGAARVAVISDGLWRRRFGGDASILGRKILLGGEPHTVAGVMPRGFQSEPRAEIWTPTRAQMNPNDTANASFVVARLKRGVTREQAQADLDSLWRSFLSQYPQPGTSVRSFTMLDYQGFLTGDARPGLLVLLGAVGMVLLVACANVANLLLARAAGRGREMAVRTALGAQRRRIMRQLMIESLLLAAAGGVLGLVAARWSLAGLIALAGDRLPRQIEATLQLPVLGYALALAVLTGLIFGLAPALQASRTDLGAALHEAGGRSGAGARRGGLRQALVAAEVALAVILVAGALLLIKTFRNLQAVDPGFDPRNVLTFRMSAPERYETTAQMAEYVKRLQERIESIPGVESAAMVTNLPTELGPDLPVEMPSLGDARDEAQWRYATPHYFDAMRMRVLQGRAFNERDTAASEPSVIVNETLVRRHFKKRPAIGERIYLGRSMGPMFAESARVIVGVVNDTREEGLQSNVPPTVYVPLTQVQQVVMRLLKDQVPFCWVVRTAGPPMEAAEAVRRAVLEVERDQPVSDVRPMEAVVGASLASYRMNSLLLTLFAGLAVLLAAVGIYGVLSHAVTRRTPEIGVRMAMGARGREILGLVVAESLKPAAVGVALGMAGAYALSRVLAGLLYGVSPRDPLSFTLVPVVLLAVCAIAAAAPALRAVRVDPVVALRYE